MLRAEKKVFVERAVCIFKQYDSFVLINAGGINVGEMTKLRFGLHSVDAKLLIIKNNLVRVALNSAESCLAEILDDKLKGSISMAYSNDVVSLSKAVCDFIKMARLDDRVVCGICKGRLLDRQGVERMSKMPSVDEMRSMIVSILSHSPRAIVTNLAYHPRYIIKLLDARLEQLKS